VIKSKEITDLILIFLQSGDTGIITEQEGQFYKGRVRCRFEYKQADQSEHSITGYNHILMSRGIGDDSKLTITM